MFRTSLLTVTLFFTAQLFAMGKPSPRVNQDPISEKYYYVDNSNKINKTALKNALAYYDKKKSSLRNKDYLTVIDFSLHSGKRRFHVIDMNSGDVESLHTAHGAGTDRNNDGYADKFSNTSNSHMSSLGFYKAAETYSGKWGYSLRLDGLSSTNSRARSRAVVIHGASYVKEGKSKMGRSWGCPALDLKHSSRIIRKIKAGSLIYAWTK